jgi:hypothetical protein
MRLGMVQGIGNVGVFNGSTVHQSDFVVPNEFKGGQR